MVNTIQRDKRRNTVSPSATASRMGVVRMTNPDISTALSNVSKSINTIGERQSKILDAKWLTKYETDTSEYMNNNVNDILLTGKQPDLGMFEIQMNSYNDKVLEEAPERLKLVADNYFQSKYMNSFEVLRNQSNKVLHKDTVDSYNKWYSNLLSDTENQYNAIAVSSSSPEMAIEGIHNYNATVLELGLIKHKELYMAQADISGEPFDETKLREQELNLLSNLETVRNNAILRSFYQNVDPLDIQGIALADLGAMQYLNSYLLDKDEVRGVNYDVFTNQTGDLVGQSIVEKVISGNRNYLAQLKSSYTNEKIKKETVELNKNVQFLDNINSAIKDVSNFESGIYIKSASYSAMTGESMEVVPYTYEDFEEFIKIQNGIDVTDEKILSLFKANKAKFVIGKVMEDSLENFGSGNKDFSDQIKSGIWDNDVALLGGETKVIEGYYKRVLSGFDFVDSNNWYEKQDAKVLENVSLLMRKNNHVTSGFNSWFNAIDLNTIESNSVESNVELLDKRLSTYNYLTQGGHAATNGISTEVSSMYDQMNVLKEAGMSYASIAKILNKKLNMSEAEHTSINTRNETFLENLNDGSGVNSRQQFVNFIVKTSDIMHINGVERGTPILGSIGAIPLLDPAQNIRFLAGKFYDKNQGLIDKVVRESTLPYLNSISNVNDNDEQLTKKLELSLTHAFKDMKESGYGTSKFMDNVSGYSYRFKPLTIEHNNLNETEHLDILSAYAYNNVENIGNDPTHPQYDIIRNQFSINGEFKLPTMDAFRELVSNGDIYVEAIDNELEGKSSMYKVVVSNSGNQFDEPFGYEIVDHLSYDGNYYNPNISTFGGKLTIENLKNTLDAAKALADGEGMFDALQSQYSKPLWRFINEKFGDLDIDKDYATLVAQLENDPNFYNFQQFQFDTKDMGFSKVIDNELILEDMKTFRRIVNDGSETYPYSLEGLNNEITNETFRYVENKYDGYENSSKTMVSHLIEKGLDKDKLYESIISGNFDYILDELNSYDGFDSTDKHEAILSKYFLNYNLFEIN